MGRAQERRLHLARRGRQNTEIFYVAPIDNLPSILERGVLPHNAAPRDRKDISDPNVQRNRAERRIEVAPGDFRALHDLVPLYFTYSTPMRDKVQHDGHAVAFLVIDLFDLCGDQFDLAFTSANAGANSFESDYNFANIHEVVRWPNFLWQYWGEGTTKSQRQAELLVAPSIPADMIRRIEVGSLQHFRDTCALLGDRGKSLVEWVPDHFDHRASAATKYEALWKVIGCSFASSPTLGFEEVDIAVGGLPAVAWDSEAWWTDEGTPQSTGWSLRKVRKVSIPRRTVTFTEVLEEPL